MRRALRCFFRLRGAEPAPRQRARHPEERERTEGEVEHDHGDVHADAERKQRRVIDCLAGEEKDDQPLLRPRAAGRRREERRDRVHNLNEERVVQRGRMKPIAVMELMVLLNRAR